MQQTMTSIGLLLLISFRWRSQWASYQIRKIAGCVCAVYDGNVFPTTDFKETADERSRHASRHVRDARAVVHVGIANPRYRGNSFRHSRRMRNPQFYVSGKSPTVLFSLYTANTHIVWKRICLPPFTSRSQRLLDLDLVPPQWRTESVNITNDPSSCTQLFHE